jgi:hypothetical protein
MIWYVARTSLGAEAGYQTWRSSAGAVASAGTWIVVVPTA